MNLFLGNIMWQREEGLASIDVVKLVTRDVSDQYDGTYELSGDSTNAETSSEHVLEMFLKRLKHHASQLHMYLEKIKIGKVGLSTLLLGNHSVLRVVLTPKISRVNQISIFISGWVVGITPYAQFCPIPSPLLLIFSKNGFEVELTVES